MAGHESVFELKIGVIMKPKQTILIYDYTPQEGVVVIETYRRKVQEGR